MPVVIFTRGSDLSGISAENLAGIEVFKAITPDMDAGSIGGVVNLMLAKAKQQPEYLARLYGSYNAMQKDFGQYKGFAKISRRFFNNSFGLQASFNAERKNRGRDRLTATYFGKDTGEESEKQLSIFSSVASGSGLGLGSGSASTSCASHGGFS